MIADQDLRLKLRRLGLATLFAGLAICAAPVAADPNPKLNLAQQKAKLLETLINTPAMKAAQDGKNPEVANWLAQSRSLLAQANSAISAARPEEAIEQLDEALRNLSKASSLLTSDGSGSAGAQKKQFDNHAAQIESYRRTLQEMTSTPQTATPARQLIVRLDAMTAQGRKLFDAGRHEEANKQMAAAYKLAVEEISRLRDGQEVVMRLQFNSPREEFDYEQKRYYSNEILVGMLLREERATGDARKQVDAYVDAAGKVKSEALAKATASDYPAAVKEMEKANQQLNRALQMMGVPVF